ncbi:MAG: ABC-type multidrug transport system, ATPase and permease component [Actinomycetia bacterium]|nr:ABC-type multidrug transport system, ATPase and permease component [Actinomycetes bacterium]
MRSGGHSDPVALDETISREEAQWVMRRLARMLRPYRRKIVIASVLLFLQTACILAGPSLVGFGIDHGLQTKDYTVLYTVTAMFLGVAIAAAILGRFVIIIVSVIGETFLRDLRERVFRHLMGLGLDFFEREKTGQLVSRMTSDIDALEELVSQGLVAIVQNILLFVGAVIVIFVLSWELALCTLIVVPPLVYVSNWFRTRSNAAYLEVRDRIGHNLATLQEGLSGVRVVQAFSREASFTRRFSETNEAQFAANLETVRIASRYFPYVEFSSVVGIALIIGVGGWFDHEGIVSVGVVAAFVLYLSNLFEPVQQLSQLYNTVQMAGAGLHKVFGLLDTKTSIAEHPGSVDLPRAGRLEVHDVSFGYTKRLVLEHVSLVVGEGERIALVGPTGAGKSTLAKLIARFYDPRSGVVSFAGIDLKQATLQSLRQRIVVVPQEGYLFTGTVRENIRIGRPGASDEDVVAAVAALGLTARLDQFERGLDTEVRERGSRLSAGERQLVSLTRAALADPSVLVLDEATSNLDPGTEQTVEQALEILMKGRTVVVVAHRLSTAARADRIGVVDEGALVELGTHAELLQRGGRYAGLYRAWDSSHAQAHTVDGIGAGTATT